MRRYYMSIVDFSEIENITADEDRKEQSRNDLKEFGLLTEKGNPSGMQIALLSRQTTERFLHKLSRRMERRPGGIEGVYKTFEQLEKKKEYTAMYMYLSFLYGFLEWRVPRKIALLPASNEALKVFFTEFKGDFDSWLQKSDSHTEDAE